jgi:hypothetical protein
MDVILQVRFYAIIILCILLTAAGLYLLLAPRKSEEETTIEVPIFGKLKTVSNGVVCLFFAMLLASTALRSQETNQNQYGLFTIEVSKTGLGAIHKQEQNRAIRALINPPDSNTESDGTVTIDDVPVRKDSRTGLWSFPDLRLLAPASSDGMYNDLPIPLSTDKNLTKNIQWVGDHWKLTINGDFALPKTDQPYDPDRGAPAHQQASPP